MLAGVLLFLAYLTTAKIGLSINAISGFAALVWAPTGIALYTLIKYGRSLWPAIAAAAFIANWWTGAPILSSLGIAAGNSLEALIGATVMERVLRGPLNLRTIHSVLVFLLVGALLSTLVSASIGVASLALASMVPPSDLLLTWVAWWAGDMLGALIVVPLLVAWLEASPKIKRPRLTYWLEASTLMICLTCILVFVFGNKSGQHKFFPYMLFPFIVWASLRFGARGATATTFVISLVAAVATLFEQGPFADESFNIRITLVQSFVGVLSATSLVLVAMLAERDDAIQTRDDFISIASHELKTPITTMKLHAQFLSQKLSKSKEVAIDSSALMKIFDATDRQLNRIDRLVDDMLDVSRISNGRLSIKLGHVDLSSLVEDVLGRFSSQLAVANCSLAKNIENSIDGKWDRERLEQVIVNLLSNAIKYAPGSPLLVELTKQDGFAVLSVSDEGKGIASENHKKVFDRFERASPPKGVSGMGLGLYISKQIIERHGGKIWLENNSKKGARFVIELPLASALETSQLAKL